ncbi:MAG: hypothetical protein PUJ69_01000 [Porphyromonas somerae]|uniref:hypothetical protein n=1 Tax=Porphyromonas somerae TaxID=322095 RepID=UPI0026F01C66|nr:hypothetical protein [Porphyromonas somerae]MDD7557236.1 hypothetical protein [Porphyromonas somerae]MDY3884590.1 hypothetical protein [Porphyromonas somerae]MDY5815672.1 hypothetical protein [Porphyromonas somerae]
MRWRGNGGEIVGYKESPNLNRPTANQSRRRDLIRTLSGAVRRFSGGCALSDRSDESDKSDKSDKSEEEYPRGGSSAEGLSYRHPFECHTAFF